MLGTFYGLCNLLTGLNNFDEILDLSTKGATIFHLSFSLSPLIFPLAFLTSLPSSSLPLNPFTSNIYKKGDSNKVDLVVGDIYGSDYSKVGLAADVIASSFGKLLYKDKMDISPR